MQRILMTGAAGAIGTTLREAFHGGEFCALEFTGDVNAVD